MKTLTRFINPVFEKQLDHAQYEVIENEVITSSDLEGLSISGSLFSLTTFKNMTFKSCVFFASRMENCTFVNCNFIDCKFEFSHISHCKFESTEFKNCNWEFSTISKNEINHSKVGVKTQALLEKSQNMITNSLTATTQDWHEAENLLLLEEMCKEEEECNSPKQWGTSLINFLKAA